MREINHYPLLAARFWYAMPPRVSKTLWRGRLGKVALTRWPIVLATKLAGPFNALMERAQHRRYGTRIAATKINQPPVFIIGHWRSGTTLLHEYLALDRRHKTPTSYQCFAPTHCLISARVITRLNFLLPTLRPMDNMEAGWERPQEDEFALMSMGLPSIYRQCAFPNEPPELDTLDFRGVAEEERRRWQAALTWFLKLVLMRDQEKRLVLKTPAHLGRVRVLLEAFPDARFVHIVRDPLDVFPSTVKLWKALYQTQALQTPTYAGLEERVFSCFERMYEQFARDRPQLRQDRLHELRYEDLVRHPLRELKTLYDRLDLGEFAPVLPAMRAHARRHQNYRTNAFQLPPEIREKIERRWGPFMRLYGYCGGEGEVPRTVATDAATSRRARR